MVGGTKLCLAAVVVELQLMVVVAEVEPVVDAEWEPVAEVAEAGIEVDGFLSADPLEVAEAGVEVDGFLSADPFEVAEAGVEVNGFLAADPLEVAEAGMEVNGSLAADLLSALPSPSMSLLASLARRRSSRERITGLSTGPTVLGLRAPMGTADAVLPS